MALEFHLLLVVRIFRLPVAPNPADLQLKPIFQRRPGLKVYNNRPHLVVGEVLEVKLLVGSLVLEQSLVIERETRTGLSIGRH